MLNNVFFNVQTPVINEESRYFPLTLGAAPYGSNNPNLPTKPGEVVVGGSVFQYDEGASARNRFSIGVEQVPTNVPNTGLDFNTNVADGVKLFVNAQAGQYLPAPQFAVDRQCDRFAAGTSSLGRGQECHGHFGNANQKRLSMTWLVNCAVDDPAVASPAGQGQKRLQGSWRVRSCRLCWTSSHAARSNR